MTPPTGNLEDNSQDISSATVSLLKIISKVNKGMSNIHNDDMGKKLAKLLISFHFSQF